MHIALPCLDTRILKKQWGVVINRLIFYAVLYFILVVLKSSSVHVDYFNTKFKFFILFFGINLKDNVESICVCVVFGKFLP